MGYGRPIREAHHVHEHATGSTFAHVTCLLGPRHLSNDRRYRHMLRTGRDTSTRAAIGCARMTELTDRITRNVAAMQQISVDIRGQRESDAPTERAAQAVKGKLVFLHLRERYVDVGRSDIDWSGAHVAHQEWPAQLNRFFQLPSLAGAYEATGDDCYAEAARDYISDWIGAHQSRADWELGPGDNTLNLSIRMLCWFANLPPLLSAPSAPATASALKAPPPIPGGTGDAKSHLPAAHP